MVEAEADVYELAAESGHAISAWSFDSAPEAGRPG
jgi:hypothetical protein